MKFYFINKYILIGGGNLLRQLILALKEAGADGKEEPTSDFPALFVVTSKRHSEEKIGDRTFLDFLEENKIKHHISDDINADEKVFTEITPSSMCLSIGAAWIIKRPFIDRFQGKVVNAHGSDLPKFRGGGGFSWRIMMDDSVGCSLLHLIDEGIDTGDIIIAEKYAIPAGKTPLEISEIHIAEYLKTLKVFFEKIRKGDKDDSYSFPLIKQNEEESTYWPRLDTETHAYIDWSWKASDIEKFIRAFSDPYAGAKTFLNGKETRIKDCEIADSEAEMKFHPFQAGIVYRIYEDNLYVATISGSLAIKGIPGARLGDRFFTPNLCLEAAKTFKAVYTPSGLKNNSIKK